MGYTCEWGTMLNGTTNGLCHYAPLMVPILIHTLPSNRAVLPLPVGTVDTSHHTRKSPRRIHLHFPPDLLHSPSVNIFGTVSANDPPEKMLQCQFRCLLSNSCVLVNVVWARPIRQQTNGCNNLLHIAGSGPSRGVRCELEKPGPNLGIRNVVMDSIENFWAHTKPTMELCFRKSSILFFSNDNAYTIDYLTVPEVISDYPSVRIFVVRRTTFFTATWSQFAFQGC